MFKMFKMEKWPNGGHTPVFFRAQGSKKMYLVCIVNTYGLTPRRTNFQAVLATKQKKTKLCPVYLSTHDKHTALQGVMAACRRLPLKTGSRLYLVCR